MRPQLIQKCGDYPLLNEGCGMHMFTLDWIAAADVLKTTAAPKNSKIQSIFCYSTYKVDLEPLYVYSQGQYILFPFYQKIPLLGHPIIRW